AAPHLFIHGGGESSDETKPVLIVQFLFRHSLRDVEQLLGDEPLEGAERLLLEHRTHGLRFSWSALAQNQLPHFSEQRRRRVRELSLQAGRADEIGKRRQLPGGKSQKGFHPVVDV